MPPHGSFFYIRSYLNGLVLDIEGGLSNPGTPCILWTQNKFRKSINQLWFQDPHNGTIRSALNDLCLDLNGDRVCINPYDEGNNDQRWSFQGPFIINHDNPMQVLDVVDNDTEPGAAIYRWERKAEAAGNRNQKWRIENAPRVHFYLESKLNGKVLDIKAGNKHPGAKCIMWDKNKPPSDNQLWYTGRDGIIHSKLNGFTIDCCEKDLKMQPLEVIKEHQCFVYSNGTLRCLHNTTNVADIRQGSKANGASLMAFKFHGGDNQIFKIVPEFNV